MVWRNSKGKDVVWENNRGMDLVLFNLSSIFCLLFFWPYFFNFLKKFYLFIFI